MARSSNHWTRSLELDFHRAVAELRELNEMPSEVQFYRDRATPGSGGHILSFQDEQQIADGLAFICHWEEGVHRVSTITLEEHPDGLIALLACNSSPTKTITRSLEEVLAVVTQYASQSKVVQLLLWTKTRTLTVIRKKPRDFLSKAIY